MKHDTDVVNCGSCQRSVLVGECKLISTMYICQDCVDKHFAGECSECGITTKYGVDLCADCSEIAERKSEGLGPSACI
jgi:hypothetical protein